MIPRIHKLKEATQAPVKLHTHSILLKFSLAYTASILLPYILQGQQPTIHKSSLDYLLVSSQSNEVHECSYNSSYLIFVHIIRMAFQARFHINCHTHPTLVIHPSNNMQCHNIIYCSVVFTSILYITIA